MLRKQESSNSAPPRFWGRRGLVIAALAALGATAAYAYETCSGCAPYVPTSMPPDDPCFIGVWSVNPTAGSCSWDAPSCAAAGSCLITVDWSVIEKPGAPSSCPDDGSFTWGANWGSGGSSATGTARLDEEQSLSNLRVQCGSFLDLTVTNGATQASVLDLSVVCSSCLGA